MFLRKKTEPKRSEYIEDDFNDTLFPRIFITSPKVGLIEESAVEKMASIIRRIERKISPNTEDVNIKYLQIIYGRFWCSVVWECEDAKSAAFVFSRLLKLGFID